MSERKPRATREESLNAKLQKNAEAKAKLQARLDELDAVEAALKKQLADLRNKKKRAERDAEKKAKKAVEAKAQKELLKAIKKSGLSAEDVKAKLGI